MSGRALVGREWCGGSIKGRGFPRTGTERECSKVGEKWEEEKNQREEEERDEGTSNGYPGQLPRKAARGHWVHGDVTEVAGWSGRQTVLDGVAGRQCPWA